MLVCFSAAELRDIAVSLGAPAEAASADGLSRAIVRRFERGRDVGALVDALRAARPFVEWPDVEVESPPTVDEGASEAAAEPAGDVAPMAAGASQAPPAATSREPSAAPAPPPASAPRAWIPPGHADPSCPPPKDAQRGIDPRLVGAVTALALVAALAAYVAGRASVLSTDEATAAAVDGVAARAGRALGRASSAVARACELPDGAAGAREVLRLAFEQCGPAPAAVPARSRARAGYDDEREGPAGVDAPPLPEPAPPRPKAAPEGAGSACVARCDGTHKACRNACGKEPTEGSLYTAYQACLATCLRDASRCRLSCDLL
jgi:hypothetical protein